MRVIATGVGHLPPGSTHTAESAQIQLYSLTRRDTLAPSSSQAAAPASHEVTETIAHEVASSAGSGQVRRPADAKDEPPTEVSMEIDEGKRGALPQRTNDTHQTQQLLIILGRSPNDQFRSGIHHSRRNCRVS